MADATGDSEDAHILCDTCCNLNKTSPGIMFCTDCDEHLCSSCTSTHKVSKATKDHRVISIDEKQAQSRKEAPVYKCDPCGLLSKDESATKHCDNCKEFLCNACYNHHTTQKATKSHKPIDVTDYHPKQQRMCDLCDKNEASKYCDECMEFYCDVCTAIHKVQKATKDHSLIEASDVKTEQCDLCKYNGKDCSSDKYCSECDEFLCISCSRMHATQKATKNHALSDGKSKSVEMLAYCDICILNDIKKAANFVCEDCKERLCFHCKCLHLKQKATKTHRISDKVKEINLKTADVFCDTCLKEDYHKVATFYCKTCEENMCLECTNAHKRLKVTKFHELTSPSENKNEHKMCDPCLEGNENIPAELFCQECDENLCNACSKAHSKQRATQHHVLRSVSSKHAVLETPCDTCLRSNENRNAIKYCMECDENFCQDCTTQHRRQKATKHHALSDQTKPKENDDFTCDPCTRMNEKSKARKFCTNCIEYFCSECEAQHLFEKSSSNHELVPAKEAKTASPKGTIYCEVCANSDRQSPATSYCTTCTEPLLFCDSCSKRHINSKANNTHNISRRIDKYTKQEDDACNMYPELSRGSSEYKDDMQQVGSSSLQTTTAMKENERKPGKPSATKIKADSLQLYWEKPHNFADGDYYKVRYKDLDFNNKWKIMSNDYYSSTIKLTDLKANTKFIFQVRMVHDDEEGPYSDPSDEVLTLMSPGVRIVNFAKQLTNETPPKYEIPLTEVRNARFEKAKSKKFEIGSPPVTTNKERTIMLVGATGTGKSTLVDGLVNYILGVNWNDPYRFTIIDMENEEKSRTQNQALSQTEWITCYTINPEQGSRLDYKLTIIDTPGFGDTRGLQRDKEIVDQIRELFSAKDAKGVCVIDAVCFLIKAPDARLTPTQTYIFHSIMSIFGQDIENNICTLITFADGQDPPVLASLKQSKLPFGNHFTFNNSGLFSKNTELDASSLSPMFWDMGLKSYRAFFEKLAQMETKSLLLTKQVLDERQKLELTISNLQPQVDAGLSKVSELKTELTILEQHKADIADNKNFEYEVDEVHQIQKELPKGQHVTNCLNCHVTCHENCVFENDEDKRRCRAMDKITGKCTVCTDKCDWTQHKNTPYIFEYITKKVKKTYQEKLKKYETASGHVLNGEQVIEKMCEELEELEEGIEELMEVVNASNNRLKEIALRPDPLSMVEHIDLMIEAEKLEKKDGWQGRVNTLMAYRKRADIHKDVERFSSEAKGTIRGQPGTVSRQKKVFNLKAFMRLLNPWSK